MPGDFRATDIAVVLVWDGGRVLVGRRLEGVPLAGLAEFPGGKVRSDETPAEAGVREVLEETGLRVRILSVREIVEHDYPHGRLRLHFLDAVPLEQEDASEARRIEDTPACRSPLPPFVWMTIEEVRRQEFPAANAGIVAGLTAPADSLRRNPGFCA